MIGRHQVEERFAAALGAYVRACGRERRARAAFFAAADAEQGEQLAAAWRAARDDEQYTRKRLGEQVKTFDRNGGRHEVVAALLLDELLGRVRCAA